LKKKKKKTRLVEKLKALLRVKKAKKWPKSAFGKSLKMKLLPKNSF
jgi:hypothetical protein